MDDQKKINLFGVIAIVVAMVLILIFGNACKSRMAFSWHQNGQLATASYDDGCIEWSDGPGKVMPLGNPSINLIGK